MDKKITLTGFFITLTGAILFSTKAIFVKLVFQSTQVDAVTLLTLRMLFALPFYLFAAWMVPGARPVARCISLSDGDTLQSVSDEKPCDMRYSKKIISAAHDAVMKTLTKEMSPKPNPAMPKTDLRLA